MDYKSIIESKYNRNSWMQLLSDIFGKRAEFWQSQKMIKDLDHTVAQWAVQLGKITLQDGNIIAVYEVELAGSVQLERNRAAIRNLLCTHWRSQGCAGAFMFCQRKNESALRFSYVSEAWTFKEDGSYVKEATEPRRYTYYLGEGHRSRTAIDQFTKLKSSDFTLKALTKAFSVEAISDMFFDGYKKQYEDIILYITGKKMVKVGGKWEEKQMGEPCAEIMSEFARFENPEKSVRDYVKRLMGRLVFIQFLQKKGWMGVPAGDSWSGGDKEFLQHLFINTPYKDTFVDDVLEPLFNDLNTRRGEDLVSSEKVGTNIKVPYLNGGLFERSAEDDTTFPLPARYMQSLIVDFFAAYNFTIDENDPNDAEVGVDAEMLGRIFENLLEDNKDKGAFYTPKEIVQYMCRESLIAYLQTETGIEEARLRKFVTEHDIKDCIAMNERQPLTKALHEVKICDPAIGSGAFPMGLLNELVACRAALGEDLRLGRAKIKRDIIQNNIYGVDIERGAVDIARLRFWLSLIVDEDNPEALPNMDFKIVQGNSLITTFNGKYLDLSGENTSPRQKNAIEALVKKLNQAQKEYFRAIGEVKLLKGIEIKSLLLDIVASQFGHELRSLAQSQDNSGFLFGDASAMTTRDIAEKANLSADMQEILNAGRTLRAKLNDETIPVAERAKLELNFFDWKIMFADVFEGKGGFDIVIGNPPYVSAVNMARSKEEKQRYKLLYPDAVGSYDLFVLFVLLGVIISKNVYCWIIPNKFLVADYAKKTKKTLIENCGLQKSIDVSIYDVFKTADVYPIIISGQSKGSHNYKEYRLDQLDDLRNNNLIEREKAIGNNIISLIDLKLTVCSGATGFEAQKIKENVINSYSDNSIPFTVSGNIDRYSYNNNNVRYMKGRYECAHVLLNDNITESKQKMWATPKIIIAGMTQCIESVYAKEKLGIGVGCYAITSFGRFSPYFIVGILNAKVTTYNLIKEFSDKHLAGGYLAINKSTIEQIKIPSTISDSIEKDISLNSELIHKAKNNDVNADTMEYERQIDNLVYVLYDLTYDEVKIVEPDFPMTEAEYNEFKQQHQDK